MSLLTVSRGDASPRIFPGPDGVVPAQTPPALLELRDAELPRRAPYTLWRLTAPQRFAQLWRHQRAAVEHEQSGHWARADYFWGLVYDQLDDLKWEDHFWRAAAEAGGAGGTPAAGADFRRRFVNEVLIDTHCALYNGYFRQEGRPAAVRAAAQYSFIRRLLEFDTLAEEERSRLVSSLAVGQMEAGEKAEDYEQAIAGCELLVKHRPHDEEYQTRLAVLEYAKTVKLLSQEPAASKTDSYLETIQTGIWRQGDFEKRHPHNLTIHELTARLYLLEAKKLGEMGKLVRALVAAEKALAHAPVLTDAWATREWLVRAMQGFFERRASIEADYQRAVMASQTEGAAVDLGDHPWQQLLENYGPAAKYSESAAAEKTRAAWHTARTHYLWKEIGLDPEGREELAPLLWDAVGLIVDEGPADRAAVNRAWDSAVSAAPDLAGIRREPVIDFLARHLLGEQQGSPAPAAAEDGGAADAPSLKVPPAPAGRSGEPFHYWLFTPKDLLIKAQAVLAIVLLSAAGLIAAREFLAGRARDTAFQQVITAVDQQDHESVIKGAEEFITNPSLSEADARESQVRRLYDEAVVRLVAEQPGELPAAVLKRLERYRQLTPEAVPAGGK